MLGGLDRQEQHVGRDQRDHEPQQVPRDWRPVHPIHESSSEDESFMGEDKFSRDRHEERVPRHDRKWD